MPQSSQALTPIVPVETVIDEDELWTNPPQNSNQEAAVDQTIYETQISPVEQRDDAIMKRIFMSMTKRSGLGRCGILC